MCASSSGPDCLQFLTDPDAASAQEAAPSCDDDYWPTWPLLGGVRQLGALSLRSLPVLAIGRAAEFCFWAARRQAPAHGLAVCPATCSRFLPVYRKARTHFFGVLSFSKVSFLSLFKNEQTKSPQKLGDLKKNFFLNYYYSSPWKAFFGDICIQVRSFTL